MHKWPSADELHFLIDYQLTAVRVSSWAVDLYLSKPPDVVIKLEKPVQVTFADGRFMAPEHLPDAGVLLIGFIGATVTSIERHSDQCAVLHFDIGSITMGEADEHYECYSIVGDNKAIYV